MCLHRHPVERRVIFGEHGWVVSRERRSGYMLSQLRGAVNPNGWSGVIEVKNPAGATAGYLLLYTNP